ncbi:hypothetical protein [Roseateles sp. BYS96W]|uniref:DUF2946 domain-containing protein n=1 Tax=Pelomonas nitida TaxID=3299027 RepID=A0ABW7G296_9BURK
MPSVLSSLLLRSRAGLLTLLLIVLPLHGALQLVAGLQAPRHRHTSAEFAAVSAPLLGKLLDGLQAEQAPGWTGAGGWHAHGGHVHRHGPLDHDDEIDVADAADGGSPGGLTAFLAWLPGGPALPEARLGNAPPAWAPPHWLERVIAPPLTPPRA